MRTTTVLTLVAFCLLVGPVTDGQATTQSQSPPDTVLTDFLNAFQKAIDDTTATKNGDALKRQLQTMRIPSPETWFTDTFSGDTGANLAAMYSETYLKSEDALVQYFLTFARPGGKLVLDVASGGDAQRATPFSQQVDDSVRRSTKHQLVLYRLSYEVTVDDKKFAQPNGYLVAVSGEYRFLGDRIIGAIPGVPARRIRQGGAVTAASLIYKMQPQYPAEAKAKHISGSVRLHAIIGTNGAVARLDVVSGDPLLAEAALEAARQWRYRPTMLNGEPVEVDTMIDMIFSR